MENKLLLHLDNMKAFLITFFALTYSIWSLSQTVTVKGKTFDFDQKKLAKVKIIYGPRLEDFTESTAQGEYKFKADLERLDTLYFKKFGHETKKIVVNKKLIKQIENNVLTLNVTLNDIQLKEVVVGVGKPTVVKGSDEYHITDYEIVNENQLVLLTYSKNIKKGGTVRLLDSTLTEKDKFNFDEKLVELRKDFRGNIHLITENRVYWLNTQRNFFEVYREDKAFFYQYISPILDTINDRIYYSNYSDIYPAFNYLEFNKTDSVYTNMLAIIDEPLMEQYRAEFKFTDVRTQLWAHHKQLETGIDKEIWVGASVFTNTVYYEPLYAPLFVAHDSVLVFDHYKNKLYKYTPDNGIVDSLKIDYHTYSKKSGWEQPLIQDKATGKVYALFMRNGYNYLSAINTNTGEVTSSFKLFYKYVENISIINGEVYYIYRPFESIQKKYLYKESIY